jgi:leucyl-tRNA synthetase
MAAHLQSARYQLSESQRLELRRKTHLTLKKVTEDMEGNFHFNTAISAIMELVNEIYSQQPDWQQAEETQDVVLEEALKTTVILLAPFVPHIAEELWERLGNELSIFKVSWPEYDPEAIRTEKVTIVVQVNGRLRARLEIPEDIADDELREIVLNDASVKKWVRDRAIKKVVIVPKKLVNVVVV